MGNSENVDKTKNDKQGESKQKYKEHLYTEKGCRVVYFVRFFFFSNKTLIKTLMQRKATIYLFMV